MSVADEQGLSSWHSSLDAPKEYAWTADSSAHGRPSVRLMKTARHPADPGIGRAPAVVGIQAVARPLRPECQLSFEGLPAGRVRSFAGQCSGAVAEQLPASAQSANFAGWLTHATVYKQQTGWLRCLRGFVRRNCLHGYYICCIACNCCHRCICSHARTFAGCASSSSSRPSLGKTFCARST